MKTSDSIVKISAAIVLAQSKVKTASKDGENTFFGNAKYATLSSVIEACKEALAEAKLAVIQAPIDIDQALYVETRVQHESGEYIEILTPLLFTKKDMQGFGAAITYAKRYALGSLLNIATEVDDDANAASKMESDANAPKIEKKPAKPLADAKDPFIFAGGIFQGKKFDDVMPEDFEAELKKYEAVPTKSENLSKLIDNMKKFKATKGQNGAHA